MYDFLTKQKPNKKFTNIPTIPFAIKHYISKAKPSTIQRCKVTYISISISLAIQVKQVELFFDQLDNIQNLRYHVPVQHNMIVNDLERKLLLFKIQMHCAFFLLKGIMEVQK